MDDTKADTGTGVDRPAGISSWFLELRRRHIFKVTAAYLVLAWLLMQVAAVLESSLKLPDWIDTATFAFLVIGFPVALILTWAVDLTPSNAGTLEINLVENGPLNKRHSIEPSQSVDHVSIAVLPFKNISGNPNDDFIGDGFAADITSGLSRIRSFFVISYNSTFQYKDTSPDVRDVSEQLSAKYIIEGEFFRHENRIRLSVQLTEGETRRNLWVEKFDREFATIFDVQDEIAKSIVTQLDTVTNYLESEATKIKHPDQMTSWESYHRGLHYFKLRDFVTARRYFEEAVVRQNNFAPPYAGLSRCKFFDVLYGTDPAATYDQAFELGLKAIELDARNASCHAALAFAYIGLRNTDKAIDEAIKAIDLNPSSLDGQLALGGAYLHSGHAENSIRSYETALRLSPNDPELPSLYNRIAHASLYLKRHQDAIDYVRKAIRTGNLNWPSRAILACAYAHNGQLDEAKKAVDDLMHVNPQASISFINSRGHTLYKEYWDHFIDGLRKAGLPEHASSEP